MQVRFELIETEKPGFCEVCQDDADQAFVFRIELCASLGEGRVWSRTERMWHCGNCFGHMIDDVNRENRAKQSITQNTERFSAQRLNESIENFVGHPVHASFLQRHRMSIVCLINLLTGLGLADITQAIDKGLSSATTASPTFNGRLRTHGEL